MTTALLRTDITFGLADDTSASATEAAIIERIATVDACTQSAHEERRADCILRSTFVMLGDAAPTASAGLAYHAAGKAIRTGDGSCAALAAATLALAEHFGSPFDVLIFRDHVVLGLRGIKGVYFETLEGGRQIGDLDLRRHKMPPSGKPIRVGAEGFLPYYLDNLAARLAEAGRRDDAERALKQGLSLAPKAGRLHYNYGTLLLDSERFEEADRHLRLAIRYGWDDADAWVNRGVALWKLGKMTKAADCFEAALKRDPKNSGALSNREALRHTSSRTAKPQRFRGEHSPSPRTTGGRIRNRR